jgi:hypothetical protein
MLYLDQPIVLNLMELYLSQVVHLANAPRQASTFEGLPYLPMSSQRYYLEEACALDTNHYD